jgi:hypothetical protein
MTQAPCTDVRCVARIARRPVGMHERPSSDPAYVAAAARRLSPGWHARTAPVAGCCQASKPTDAQDPKACFLLGTVLVRARSTVRRDRAHVAGAVRSGTPAMRPCDAATRVVRCARRWLAAETLPASGNRHMPGPPAWSRGPRRHVDGAGQGSAARRTALQRRGAQHRTPPHTRRIYSYIHSRSSSACSPTSVALSPNGSLRAGRRPIACDARRARRHAPAAARTSHHDPRPPLPRSRPDPPRHLCDCTADSVAVPGVTMPRGATNSLLWGARETYHQRRRERHTRTCDISIITPKPHQKTECVVKPRSVCGTYLVRQVGSPGGNEHSSVA